MKHLGLAQKNREVNPESWDELYGLIVSRKFREKYSNDKCEAIVNNYLDDPANEKYSAEFKEMQDYRKQCKALAKAEMGIAE
jgi:hypothetical protein